MNQSTVSPVLTSVIIELVGQVTCYRCHRPLSASRSSDVLVQRGDDGLDAISDARPAPQVSMITDVKTGDTLTLIHAKRKRCEFRRQNESSGGNG